MATIRIDERLRDAVEARIAELRLSPGELVEATGLSGPGLANVRRGEIRRYQTRLTRPLCEALGWSPDSIERILAGGDPIPIAPAEPDEISQLRDALASVQDRIRRVEALAERTAERLLALSERVLLPDADDEPSPGESRTAR